MASLSLRGNCASVTYCLVVMSSINHFSAFFLVCAQLKQKIRFCFLVTLFILHKAQSILLLFECQHPIRFNKLLFIQMKMNQSQKIWGPLNVKKEETNGLFSCRGKQSAY